MYSFGRVLLAGVAMLGISAAARADDEGGRHGAAGHVLLISVDGMHEVDLRLWIKNHPGGALAALAQRGTTYSQAMTTAPSDSYPGIIAQATGGTPYSTGVFYDDSYDRTLYAPSSNCAGTAGTETAWAENLDYSLADVTGGGKLGDPLSQINPANLPMAKVNGNCVPVYPHQFIRVNTIFEVLRAHGMHTAWSDKHAGYEILNGPSGKGIEDLFTPEINSQQPGAPAGQDNTTSFKGVRDYDSIKVNAVLNEIQAKHSTGYFVGYVPAIFGMNFQAVSVGQKLATAGFGDDPSLVGGYTDAAGTPGNALTLQLQFIDDSIGKMVEELKSNNVWQSTAIIISAKHGQSPIDRTLRRAIKDTYSSVLATDGWAFDIADDAALIWLDPSKRTAATLASAETHLKAASAAMGIQTLLDRDDLKKIFRDPATDSRTPDFFVVANHGVIYTGGTKLAEHGGVAADDRHVGMLVSAPGLEGSQVTKPVFTTQIAPTILRLLGVSPNELQAVRIERTEALPDLSE
jgi:Type I phosphodiesterase / nucleotide pyrophosphatase